MADVFAEFSKYATVLGIPGALGYFARRIFLRTRAERLKDNAGADVEVATVADRIKTSSVTAVEAQMVAMTGAFTAEREAKDRTLAFQKTRIGELEEYATSRDLIIATLRTQVEDLQRQLAATVEDFQRQLAAMAQQIEGL